MLNGFFILLNLDSISPVVLVKYTEIKPVNIPRRIYKGILFRTNGSVKVKLKTTFLPSKKNATVAPVTEDISRGIIDHIVKSNINTSRAKIIAVSGALKIPANAAAEPQPISKVVVL